MRISFESGTFPGRGRRPRKAPQELVSIVADTSRDRCAVITLSEVNITEGTAEYRELRALLSAAGRQLGRRVRFHLDPDEGKLRFYAAPPRPREEETIS